MRTLLLLTVAASALASSVSAQSLAVIEQDTRHITLALVETVTSPTPATRRTKVVSISAWPELWQDSFTQISEYELEVDCWNRRITFDSEVVHRDIRGEELGQSVGSDPVTWPISDGYEPFERFLCDNQTSVSVAPFRSLEEVKKYYFTWLQRNVPVIKAD